MNIPTGVTQPWQLTEQQWNQARESIRPNVAQSRFTGSSKSESERRCQDLNWLCFGIVNPDRPVTYQDVIGKARREGLVSSLDLPEKMVIPAFRYCLGRMSYIVGDCADFLCENWNALGENTRSVIKRELEEAFARDDSDRQSGTEFAALGMSCDRAQWGRVRKLWEGE